MLKPSLLDPPRRGALNMHGSLLPQYRGRVPVNWVLVHGETETGMTLTTWRKRPTGATSWPRTPITPEDTAVTLFAKMTVAAEDIMRETYPLLRAGSPPGAPGSHRGLVLRRPAAGRRHISVDQAGQRDL